MYVFEIERRVIRQVIILKRLMLETAVQERNRDFVMYHNDENKLNCFLPNKDNSSTIYVTLHQ